MRSLSPSELRALRAIQQQQSGKDVFINAEDAEECVNKGWAEPIGNLRYVLTKTGEKLVS